MASKSLQNVTVGQLQRHPHDNHPYPSHSAAGTRVPRAPFWCHALLLFSPPPGGQLLLTLILQVLAQMTFYSWDFSHTSPTDFFLSKPLCSCLPHRMGASWKQWSTLHICVPRPLIWHTVRFTYMNWVDPGYFPTCLPKGKNEKVGHLVAKFRNDTETGHRL